MFKQQKGIGPASRSPFGMTLLLQRPCNGIPYWMLKRE
jgi:hypothetical protein